MVLAWGAIIALIVGLAAVDGGRNCQVPKSGPFHRLLEGRNYVPSHRVTFACVEVSNHQTPRGRNF
jgi:hypothetical protein